MEECHDPVMCLHPPWLSGCSARASYEQFDADSRVLPPSQPVSRLHMMVMVHTHTLIVPYVIEDAGRAGRQSQQAWLQQRAFATVVSAS